MDDDEGGEARVACRSARISLQEPSTKSANRDWKNTQIHMQIIVLDGCTINHIVSWSESVNQSAFFSQSVSQRSVNHRSSLTSKDARKGGNGAVAPPAPPLPLVLGTGAGMGIGSPPPLAWALVEKTSPSCVVLIISSLSCCCRVRCKARASTLSVCNAWTFCTRNCTCSRQTIHPSQSKTQG